MIKNFTLFIFLLFSLSLFGQNFESEWKQVIELEEAGSIKSALAEVNKIHEKAIKTDNDLQIIKAFFFRSKYIQTLEEDAQTLIIKNIRKDIQRLEEPNKTMLQYIYISILNSYVNSNKFRIKRRTPTEETVTDDFMIWTLPDFEKKIDSIINKSLSKKALLQKQPLSQFELILNFNSLENLKNKNVYDFLVQKYIDLYSSNLSFSSPDSLFTQKKKAILGSTPEFLAVNFDSLPDDYLKKTSLLYQELERENKNRDDLTLKRIEFFENRIYKDPSQFLELLTKLQTKIKDTAVIKEIQLKRADIYSKLASKEHFPHYNKIAIKILDSLLSEESRTNTYKTAFLKKASLQAKEVNVQMEKFVYVAENNRAFVKFKNADSLYLKIYKVSSDFPFKKSSFKRDSLVGKIIENENPFISKSYKLPNQEDYFQHTTEILLPKLPMGTYLVSFQPEKLAINSSNKKDYTFITVTDLALIHKDGDNTDYFQAVHRKTGAPIKKAVIDLDGDTHKTDTNGTAKIKRQKKNPKNLNYGSLDILKEDDTLNVDFYKRYYYKNSYDDEEDFNGAIKFFLDRAIYRPGQKVYVKGIAIQNKKNVKSVVPKLTVLVEVTDSNDDVIKEIEVQTNEFGSFTFDFIIPKNGPTGSYYIEAEEPDEYEKDPLYNKWNGEHRFWDYVDLNYDISSFQVEEYKRPTFKIEFDSLAKSYVVNQNVEVSGKAKSFSGVNLSDSKVKYRIERKSYPNYRNQYYSQETITLKEGETVTKEDGSFTIDFDAQPNKSFDKKDLPLFHYTIYTDITDSRGENQSAEKTVKFGYHNLALSLEMPSLIDSKKENKVIIKSTDLNGKFIPTKGKVSIYFLSPFGNKFKDRVFPKPDIPGFTAEEFERLFPYEDNASTEEQEGTLIFSKEVNTETDKEINLDFLKSEEAGNYRIVFSASDSEDNIIESKSTSTLFHGENGPTNKLFTLIQKNSNPFADGFVEVEIRSEIPTLYINVLDTETSKFALEQVSIKNGYSKIKIPINRKRTETLNLIFQSYFENQYFAETISVEKEKVGDIDIAIKSFRNKIEPGSEQTWNFTVSQRDQALNAEVLASMYDSSLDQFKVINWEALDLHNYYGRSYYSIDNLSNDKSFTTLRGLNAELPKFHFTQKYVELFWFGFDFNYPSRFTGSQSYKKQISATPSNASTVYGIITDDAGLPLPGANVVIKGTSRGTQSDFDGYYSIEVAPGEELEFSYVGFDSQSVVVKSNQYDISLETGSALEEVVVTGYEVRNKTVMTSAVVSVNVNELLEGKTVGILVSPMEGKPGQGSMIRLRGTGSLSATETEALIIIDGVPIVLGEGFGNHIDGNIISLSDLNSDNIASISILKGEEATALYGSRGANGVIVITTKSALEELAQVTTRKNFNETAFFQPQLRTDKRGNITFNFTTPEALTQWKLRLFAHDKKAQSGYLENFVITQKELMIQPNMPRFFREKDSIYISARISNMTSENKTGMAMLQLFDAIDMKPIHLEMGNIVNHKNFETAPKGSATVTWKIKIPEGIQGVQYKVLAKSGNFTDGEENLIPVLTNSILVTESIPIWVKGGSEKEYSFDYLKNNTSTTLKNHQLTLEYTSNPTWLAIQALPYLMEYEHDCSEQVFARYYANSIAAEILNSNPKIAEYFRNNKKEDPLSKLEQNEELKSIILTETPWFRDSQTDEEKKARMVLLFDLEKLAEAQDATFEKLREQQMVTGAFPWFDGGEENEFITRHIVAGFGKLNKEKNSLNPKYASITSKAVSYLDQKFRERIRREKSRDYKPFTTSEIHYLYARSFYLKNNPVSDSLQVDIDKKLKILKEDLLKPSLYEKGMAALIFHRFGDSITAGKIVNNLRETASNNEDWGMYWIENKPGWYWYRAPIETQALLIEAFAEIENDRKAVDEMKVWLLKNKQVKHWSSTKSTSEAINAMLKYGSDWTDIKEETTFKLGESQLLEAKLAAAEKQVETGYFKVDFDASEIKKDMADLTIRNNSEVPGFGGFYWQYFEESDKIVATTGKPLTVKKELFLKKNTSKGQELQRIKNGNSIEIGDLVTVRLIISSKEDMEYVHLKDRRASGFEPVDVLSKYSYTDGLGYYKSTRDAATHFFFDRITKGTYVLEYEVRANNPGNFSNGITNIQSMYAPEFGSHSEGIRVVILE